MTDLEVRLAEIRQRHAAASPPPWTWDDSQDALQGCPEDGGHVIGAWWDAPNDKGGVDIGSADAEFIAHAPEDISLLLRTVDRLQALVADRVRQVEQLKARLRELEWSRWGECPVCGASSSDGEPHGPECWLWLAIRTA